MDGHMDRHFLYMSSLRCLIFPVIHLFHFVGEEGWEEGLDSWPGTMQCFLFQPIRSDGLVWDACSLLTPSVWRRSKPASSWDCWLIMQTESVWKKSPLALSQANKWSCSSVWIERRRKSLWEKEKGKVEELHQLELCKTWALNSI